MNSLSSLARALGGAVVGHQVLCPGPNHSKKDRSLSVRLSVTAPEGFVVHSHCGDDPLTCRDHVRALLGWDRPVWERGRRDVPIPATKPQAIPDSDEAAKIARAVAIWDAAVDPRGSVVERYLASRGLEIPWEASGEALRFHPRCPWRDEADGRTILVPAMVCALRSITTEEVTGVHRTRLAPDGRKVDRRMLGRAAGSAVMLCPYTAIGGGLAIGEGVETTIAAMMVGWRSAWALGSVGAIERFPVLTGLQSLVLLAENDDSGASQRAVEAAGRRYGEAGREVIIVTPRDAGDANDAIRRAAA